MNTVQSGRAGERAVTENSDKKGLLEYPGDHRLRCLFSLSFFNFIDVCPHHILNLSKLYNWVQPEFNAIFIYSLIYIVNIC